MSAKETNNENIVPMGRGFSRKKEMEYHDLIEHFKSYTVDELLNKLDNECDKEEYGKVLTYMRKKYFGDTQSDFSDRIAISRAHIVNLENGRTLPSSKLRKRIAHVFRVKFGMEKEDAQDIMYYALNPDASKELEPAQLDRLYSAIERTGIEKAVDNKENELKIKSSYGKFAGVPTGSEMESAGIFGTYKPQWVEPVQRLKAPFLIDPPVTDDDGNVYSGLKAYYFDKFDEECEFAGLGDCLVYNPEKKFGTEKDLFLFKYTKDENYFVGRLYVKVGNEGIPQAHPTIVHSFRYLAENANKDKIEEPVTKPCECIGHIVHIKRDMKKLDMDFLN